MFLAGHTVAMVTFYINRMTTTPFLIDKLIKMVNFKLGNEM